MTDQAVDATEPSTASSDIPAAECSDTRAVTTASTSARKLHLTAHHAWAWYREGAEPPPIPGHQPGLPEDPGPTPPTWPVPPSPAPRAEQLHALIADAATQARNHLLSGTALECARDEDAVRLAAVIPHIRVSEIADRLGLDVAELRHRLGMR
ncbi:hypothetical protein GCM10010519_35380 [Streptomyces lactacystinicus]